MIVPSLFRPARGLSNPHLQTLWASVLRRRPRVALRRERLELPDGDFVDLDWVNCASDTPLVVVLHGLEGSSASNYAAGLMAAIARRGWRGAVAHARGCSGEPNRLARGYHAADVDDVAWVCGELNRRAPHRPIAAVGYSLGGSVLLNWLATAAAPGLRTAVAVSVPFELAACARRLNRGFSRLYQRHLLRRLYRSLQRKQQRIGRPAHLPRRPRSFRAFDDLYTAPLHGFRDADDYYLKASCRARLARIRTPTLILQAADDPFLEPEALPRPTDLAPAVTLEIARHGGHVGFVAGSLWRPRYWLEERILRHLDAAFHTEGGPTPQGAGSAAAHPSQRKARAS